MKKYLITIKNTLTGEELFMEELSKTAKYLKSKYESRHRFDEQKKTIKIKRLFKKPGIQINLIDQIDELTK